MGIFSHKPEGPTISPRAAISLDDAEVLRRMFNSRNGADIAHLYHGHSTRNASEADIALCGRLAFWTGKDAAQMDRLFRSSGLMRDKWDTRRGDSTYGATTIGKAVANCRETYSVDRKVTNIEHRRAETMPAATPTQHEWTVTHHPAFAFKGPTGNAAIADLAILTRRDGSPPVVVATEREDNPGVSVTGGAEQLAAHVLTRLLPDRVGEQQPFRLVEHYRAVSLGAGLGNIAPTMQEVRFADFVVRDGRCGSQRIGEAVEWTNLDARVARVLAEQTIVKARRVECVTVEPPQRRVEEVQQSRGFGR